MEWHLLSPDEALDRLSSHRNGLSAKEVQRRRAMYGANTLAEEKKTGDLMLFLAQFRSALVIILLAATGISAFIGELFDALFIFAIVVMNAVLGFVQERNAARSLAALRRLSAPQALALRDGAQRMVPAEELVPGDIVLLKAGDRVPADCRVIEQANLRADESLLTGESLAAEKHEDAINDAPVPERTNMLFAGTTVVYGRCVSVVVETGMRTEFGRIASMLQAGEEDTPLQKDLATLGRQIGMLIMAIAAIVFISGAFLGQPLLPMFIMAVALAVAAIPEGLPAVVTITLALGLQTMAKKNAIIRKLPAVETLGATDVICSDKTGTLTMNELTVQRLYVPGRDIAVSGDGYGTEGSFTDHGTEIGKDRALELLLAIGARCNDANLDQRIGDPTELALLVAARKAGIVSGEKRTGELPFDSGRKMMSVAYGGKERICYTKGAAEAVLEKSTHLYRTTATRMSEKDRHTILAMTEQYASQGYRVLGFAYKALGPTETLSEERLVFVGLQAMKDTPRPEAKQAIEKCRRAGITVVMITGDHQETAVAIARELGIGGRAMTGRELDVLKDGEFLDIVEEVGVYARVSPEHKVRITDALKRRGHVVAMTGDGINDAPALKNADIGIAMGLSGTDVAKESSDMVLTDDNFASIVSAVEEGRGLYDNIRKFVYYLLSANIGEVLIIFFPLLLSFVSGSAFLLPLIPVQFLWINLITDGLPAIALGLEQKEGDVMDRKPRKKHEPIITKHAMSLMLFRALLIAAGTLFIFYWFLGGGIGKARTAVFTALIFFELFMVLSMRSEQPITAQNFGTNRKLLIAVLASMALQIAILYTPFGIPFEISSISLNELVQIIAISSTGFFALELKKKWARNSIVQDEALPRSEQTVRRNEAQPAETEGNAPTGRRLRISRRNHKYRPADNIRYGRHAPHRRHAHRRRGRAVRTGRRMAPGDRQGTGAGRRQRDRAPARLLAGRHRHHQRHR